LALSGQDRLEGEWRMPDKKRRGVFAVNIKMVLYAFAGSFVTIFLLSFITSMTDIALLIAPFGASCVLTFTAWEASFSQPGNIIGGHFISSVIGLTVLQIWGSHSWTIALAVGAAIAVMLMTKTVHPPAGADPIIIMLGNNGWRFLLFPILTGSALVVIMSILINRFVFKRTYPTAKKQGIHKSGYGSGVHE
jgi:CBS-domain-containing membrane protein